MSESDQLRQYAEEAMVWVAQAKTEEEKQLLLRVAVYLDGSGGSG